MNFGIEIEENMPKKLKRRIRKVKAMINDYQKKTVRDYKIKLIHEYMDLGGELLVTFDEERRTDLKRRMAEVQKKYDDVSKTES